MDLVKFLEENNSTMSDFSLIDNLRNLSNLLSNRECDLVEGDHSVRYKRGTISEDLLESMMVQTFDLMILLLLKQIHFSMEINL